HRGRGAAEARDVLEALQVRGLLPLEIGAAVQVHDHALPGEVLIDPGHGHTAVASALDPLGGRDSAGGGGGPLGGQDAQRADEAHGGMIPRIGRWFQAPISSSTRRGRPTWNPNTASSTPVPARNHSTEALAPVAPSSAPAATGPSAARR